MTKKIIKSAQMSEDAGPTKRLMPEFARSGVVSKEELSAQEKGQRLIAEAELQAEKILKEARALKERLEEEVLKAKQRGFEEGKLSGLASLTTALQEATELKKKIYSEAEPEIIKMVVSISKKIIGDLAQKNKEVIYSVVKQALEHSLGDKIVVRLHSEDLKRLKGEDLQFKEILDRTKHLHFKEDDSIEKGGCIVETEIGSIDAQLETQLKAIRKAMGI